MTAPVIAQPDAEAWIVQNLAPLRGVTVFVFSAVQLGLPGWLWSYSVQVDARTGRKAAARSLAEQARQIMLALPDVPWDAGTVSYAHADEGPFWMPDDDGGPRYCGRYEIRAHPPRGAWQPAPLKLRAGTPAAPGHLRIREGIARNDNPRP
jgi:hypothetical protein